MENMQIKFYQKKKEKKKKKKILCQASQQT